MFFMFKQIIILHIVSFQNENICKISIQTILGISKLKRILTYGFFSMTEFASRKIHSTIKKIFRIKTQLLLL